MLTISIAGTVTATKYILRCISIISRVYSGSMDFEIFHEMNIYIHNVGKNYNPHHLRNNYLYNYLFSANSRTTKILLKKKHTQI